MSFCECQRSHFKAILKYWNYPSILPIKEKTKCCSVWENVIKEIKYLDASKGSKENDIPENVIKTNSEIFSNLI